MTNPLNSPPPMESTPPLYTPYASSAPSRTNVLSIISLVAALVSPLSAFFMSVVAIVTGHIALNQIRKSGEKGRGLAIAGLVIGYVGIVFGIVFLGLIIIGSIASPS